MDKAVYAILTGNAPVAAVIAARAYTMHAPQNPTYPLVAFTPTSASNIEALGASTTIRTGFYDVACIASTYTAASDLADLVIAALSRFHGVAGTITVEDVFLAGKSVERDDTLNVYVVSLDFNCLWRV